MYGEGLTFQSRLAEGNWEGNHGGDDLVAGTTVRLAEGNWEGNHGAEAHGAEHALRLAEGNWEGNHGIPPLAPSFPRLTPAPAL